MRRFLGAALLIALLGTCWYGYRLVWGVPLDINHFADRSAIRLLYEFPEAITTIGGIDNTPLDFHSDRLSDLSPAAEQRRRLLLRETAETLRAYDAGRLEGQRRLTWDYLDWTYSARLDLIAFPYHVFSVFYQGPYPANQTSGAQDAPLTILSQYQQVVDEDSAQRYLRRMAAIPAFLANLRAALAHREQIGVLPPRIVVTRLIERAAALLEKPARDWSVHMAFTRALDALEMRESIRRELLARNLELLDAAVIPAYREYLAYLEAARSRAPEAVGVWVLPDGDAYYRALLRYYTTTDMAPEAVHELGLARVEAIRRQMDDALHRLGYVQGPLEARLAAFVASPGAGWPPDAAASTVRAQILAEYERLNEELRLGTAAAFRDMPPQPLAVRRVPPEEEIGEAGAYYRAPALDGSRPGIFFVNLRVPSETQRFAMRTLAAHEGIPGHHFDSAISMQLTGLPMVRKMDYIAAHSEGWALYAERLVAELGLHDPFSDMGRLQAEMLRAVRLVVDTGIHARRWTRQQAIDYMVAQTGMTRGEVVSEIERYIALPGQACAYMVGMLEILKLREAARARQGERFRLADFHHVVLGNGALPLSVLRREVERRLH